VAIQEKKDEIFEIAKHVTLQIKEERDTLSCRLNAIAKEFMVMYEQSKVLKGFINEVEETEKVTRKAHELFTLKKALCDIKSIHSQVSEAAKDMDHSAQFSPFISSEGPKSLDIGIGDPNNRASSSERRLSLGKIHIIHC